MSTAEHMFHVVRSRTFAALILRGSSFLLVIVLSGCGAFIAHAPSRAVSHHASATPAPKPTVVPVAVPTACAASIPKSYSDVFNVRTTYSSAPGGLRTSVLVPGCGPAVVSGDVVTVQYTEWLQNGSEFASSREAGHSPLVFQVGAGSVIAGLDEGVVGMRIGEIRRIVVPSTLAFGKSGSVGIPANESITFNIELLAIGKYRTA